MKFANPGYLISGVILTAALSSFLIWAWRNYVKRSSAFADSRTLRMIDADYSDRRMLLGYALLGAAALFIFIALARPQWGFYWSGSSDSGRDIIFAIDLSRSMLCKDVSPDRLSRAKAGIARYAASAKGDRLALIGFAGDAFLYCPFTMNRNSFLRILDNLETGSVRKGGTSYYGLMETAVRSIGGAVSQEQDKIMAVLSDGEDTEGGLDKAIEEAKKSGITVYAIGVGTSAGGTIPDTKEGSKADVVKDDKGKPVRTRLDEAALKRLAEGTGGEYMADGGRADAVDALGAIWEAKSGPTAAREIFGKVHKERFQIPLFIAFICLSAELLLSIANRGGRR